MEALLVIALVAACCGLPLLLLGGASVLKGKGGDPSEVGALREGKQPEESGLHRFRPETEQEEDQS